MKNLTELLERKNQTRLAVAKFLYQSGTNVALYNATRDPKFKLFKSKLENTIIKQVLDFTETRVIEEVGNEFTPTLEIITKYFESFGLAFPGGVAALDKLYRWAGEKGGQAALDKLGIGKLHKALELTFNLKDPRFLAELTNYRNFLIDSVDDTTKQWLANIIQNGKENQLTNAEIAQIIKDSADEFGEYRAKLIAETEVARAMTYVERQTYIENNVNQMAWRTSEDATVDDLCAANEDAGAISVNASFPSGDSEPPAHPNCRCYLEPIFDNDFLSREGDFYVGE